MMKIVVLGDVNLNRSDIEELQKVASLDFYPERKTDPHTILKLIDDADILISELIPLPKDVIDHTKNLKFITLATTGFDDIDLDAAQRKGITVCYTPGYATEAVAEHTIGLMLAAARLLVPAANSVKLGEWSSAPYLGKELAHHTLGIIGYGSIGKRVGEIAQAGFSMKLQYTDKNSSEADLEQLLQTSDFISLHVPLTNETRNMIGEKAFERMKPGVVIVNTARGGTIDEKALIKNVESGKVFAAGLDVLADEPMKKDNPIFNHPRIIITPHMAYNTTQAVEKRSDTVKKNILAYLRGNPQNAICIPE
jgi:phosphoglycerate dehydrogenase-like enzyme